MSTEQLQKLRESLPKKHLDILSKRTGFSTVYIWQVLNGERNNNVIIDAAIELAKEEKANLELRAQAIESL